MYRIVSALLGLLLLYYAIKADSAVALVMAILLLACAYLMSEETEKKIKRAVAEMAAEGRQEQKEEGQATSQ